MNEIVIFVGIPASGKTSFYKERFFPSHVYVSQDQLRTSSAVEELFRFCIRRNKNCVIDKCNISVLDRQKYIRVVVQGRQGPVERLKFFVDHEIPIFTSRDADDFWRQFV